MDLERRLVGMLRSTEDFLESSGDALRNYRSGWKVTLDKYLDPAMAWTALNTAYLAGSDQLLEFVNRSVESHTGAAMVAAYAGLTAGLVAANKYLFLPLSKRVHDWQERRESAGKRLSLLSFLRTGCLIAGLGIGIASSYVQDALSNFRYDAIRIIDAFERPIVRDVRETPSEMEERALPEYPVKRNGGPVIAGALEGRNIPQNSLFSFYTGLSGTVHDDITVDFNAQLDLMLRRKADFCSRRGWQVSPAVYDFWRTHVADYQAGRIRHSTMTLGTYLAECGRSIQDVRDNIDWSVVKSQKGLNENELHLLRDISNALTEHDLLSYALTELMPGKDGNLNKAVLDFMLRNAGREYVEMIPAMYDKYASFGLYQWTSFAVNGSTGEGASSINQALPMGIRIPGSVISLRSNDHHKAAYLFAINNLADMIDSLNRSELATLSRVWSSKKEDIVQYIATAHHLPANARKAARRWLDNGARSGFNISCDSGIRDYADQTAANLAAMYSTGVNGTGAMAAGSARSPSVADPRSLLGFDYIRTRSDGIMIFRRTVQSGEWPYRIADAFNQVDDSHGNNFADVHGTDVVNARGSAIGNSVRPGQQLYVRAMPHRRARDSLR